MGDVFRCPHCGRPDQQIEDYSRRELRQSLGSRVNRRKNTKSPFENTRGEKVTKTRPAVRLAQLMKEARREHVENCPELEAQDDRE